MCSYRAYTSLQRLPTFAWQRLRALEGLIIHRPVCARCPRSRVVDLCPIIDNDHGRMPSRRERNRESDGGGDTVIAYGHRRFNSSHVRYLHLARTNGISIAQRPACVPCKALLCCSISGKLSLPSTGILVPGSTSQMTRSLSPRASPSMDDRVTRCCERVSPSCRRTLGSP